MKTKGETDRVFQCMFWEEGKKPRVMLVYGEGNFPTGGKVTQIYDRGIKGRYRVETPGLHPGEKFFRTLEAAIARVMDVKKQFRMASVLTDLKTGKNVTRENLKRDLEAAEPADRARIQGLIDLMAV